MTIDYQLTPIPMIEETNFSMKHLKKFESIFTIGNGYLGVRSATEEYYQSEQRNTFVVGTFNSAFKNEVTELPNLPDVFGMEIEIDGEILDLRCGEIRDYSRKLNINNGEVTRRFIWKLPSGKNVRFEFRRFASQNRKHVIVQFVEIEPLDESIQLKIHSGIDGRMTNSGVQHFSEGQKQFVDGKYLSYSCCTNQSEVEVAVSSELVINGAETVPRLSLERRKIEQIVDTKLSPKKSLKLTKKATFYTSRDLEMNPKKTPVQQSIEELININKLTYAEILQESTNFWEKNVWKAAPIEIKSKNKLDQLGIWFAQYHLHSMTPFHDERMNIGAKGLSGEGYKGHTFWDTEIFLLPYFIYHYPEQARKLLTYRYLILNGARKKAKEYGYHGAMYPWESAWIDDGEVTPLEWGTDVVTGEPIKILTGSLEQHISSDVVYGIKKYVQATGDVQFLGEMGYEIIFEVAWFWISRLEWNEQKQRYEINNVIGPDEYKEHVNNNSYTNYMAEWVLQQAKEDISKLKEIDYELYEEMNNKFQLDILERECKEKISKIYLPLTNEKNVLPQDDTYLMKKVIDLKKYKKSEKVGIIFDDYNLEQINQIQVSKQADVLLLLLLQPERFSNEERLANWKYYEPKTLHDSSLSLSTHCILACEMDEIELAYQLFQRAYLIDMGSNMKSSDEGIHAASFGGVWQCLFFGFAGIRQMSTKLVINPKLPDEWEQIHFEFMMKNDRFSFTATKSNLTLVKLTQSPASLAIEVRGKQYLLESNLKIELGED